MIETVLQIIAPHHCCACGILGSPLCSNCKYNIISESFSGCIICGKLAGPKGICSSCNVPYEQAWCVGERSDGLKQLIDNYKFYRMKAAHRSLADLLHDSLPELPADTVVVPVPTISAHIRQRGYDHTSLLAKRFGTMRKLRVSNVLERATNTKQRGANKRQRIEQAKRAFSVRNVDSGCPYLLIDDVTTTGATLHYAAQTLRDAGVKHIMVAVTAKQPLED